MFCITLEYKSSSYIGSGWAFAWMLNDRMIGGDKKCWSKQKYQVKGVQTHIWKQQHNFLFS